VEVDFENAAGKVYPTTVLEVVGNPAEAEQPPANKVIFVRFFHGVLPYGAIRFPGWKFFDIQIDQRSYPRTNV
jgi:hypothetical protein